MAILRVLFGEHADIIRDGEYQVLLYSSIISAMGMVLLSPLLEELTGPFGISEVQAGLLITAFVAPAAIVVPLVGSLADQYGRRPVLAISLVVFGLAGTSISLTTDYRIVLTLRALQGIGSAGIIPVVIASLGDRYAEEEPTAQGLRITAVGTAQTVVPLLGGFLVGVAWQYPFLLYALALPAAILVAVRFEDTADTGVTDADNYVKNLLALLKRPRVIGTLVAIPMPVFIYISFLTYSSFLIVRTLHGSPEQVGLLLGLANGAWGVAASQTGRATVFFEKRTTPIVFSFGLLAGGMVVFAQAPGLVVAGIGSIVMAFGGGLSSSLLLSTLTQLAPERLRAGLVSISQMALRAGMAIAPVVVGGSITLLETSVGDGGAIRGSFVAVGLGAAFVGVVATLLPRVLFSIRTITPAPE